MSRIIYQIFDYVIRRFNAPSADLKADWIFAETPLSAISRFNWSPESAEASACCSKAPRENDSLVPRGTGLQSMPFNNPSSTRRNKI
jgi:hypothetical protein